jgi:arabinose-5-phosphate isomerase
VWQAKKLTMDEYAMNHPAGRIGKRLILKVADVMKKGDDLPVSSADATLMSELVKLSSAGVGCLLIVDAAGKLEGVFTDGDLRRHLKDKGGDVLEMTMGQLMCKTPRTVSPLMKAVEAMAAMESPTPVTFMPVVEDGKLEGLITLHTLVSAGL